MQKLPTDWVERIFERLECTYKSKWTCLVGDERRKNIYLNQWSTGLAGLTPQEIKRALAMCECSYHDLPPTVVEFYHMAKGLKVLKRKDSVLPMTLQTRELAEQYLTEIRSKLHGNVSQGT